MTGLRRWAERPLRLNRRRAFAAQLATAAAPAAAIVAASLIATRAGVIAPAWAFGAISVAAVGSIAFAAATHRHPPGCMIDDPALLDAADRAVRDPHGRIRSGFDLASETPPEQSVGLIARAIDDAQVRLASVTEDTYRAQMPRHPWRVDHPIALATAVAALAVAFAIPPRLVSRGIEIAGRIASPSPTFARSDAPTAANAPEADGHRPRDAARRPADAPGRASDADPSITPTGGAVGRPQASASLPAGAGAASGQPADGLATPGDPLSATASADSTASVASNKPASAKRSPESPNVSASSGAEKTGPKPNAVKAGRSSGGGDREQGEGGDQHGAGRSPTGADKDSTGEGPSRESRGDREAGRSATIDQSAAENPQQPKQTVISRGSQGANGAEMSMDRGDRSGGGDTQTADRKQRGVAPQILGVAQPDVIAGLNAGVGPEVRSPQAATPGPEPLPPSAAAPPAPASPPSAAADRSFTVDPGDRASVAAYFRALESSGKPNE